VKLSPEEASRLPDTALYTVAEAATLYAPEGWFILPLHRSRVRHDSLAHSRWC
jgi:hypothetical protein